MGKEAMTKFRKTGPDVMQPKRKPKPPPPAFNVDASRVPILDSNKVLKGHCGPKASESILPRFGIKNGGTLQKVQGRECWVGNPGNSNSVAQQQMAKLRASLRGARGSVSSRSRP
jgi:hypothetical protein